MFCRNLLFLSLLLSTATIGFSQVKYWNDVLERNVFIPGKREIIPEQYRLVRLNKTALKRELLQAPLESSRSPFRNQQLIELPLPDGTIGEFAIVESPVAEPGLLRKYPELKTYLGHSISDPSIVVRFDFLKSGLHAMIRSDEGIIFIDPYTPANTEYYISYDVKYHHPNKSFVCHGLERAGQVEHSQNHQNRSSSNPVGENLKLLRVAIACTGEYASFHNNRGTAPLDAIVTTLNRVNLLYETEVATRMLLISNNDLLIYNDPATDPYTNNDLNAMLEENKTNLRAVIGEENYDLGHVFGTSGGGLAGINVICFDAKEWGASGISSPTGDFFDVVYVGHEMGHQFGAPHTFNSCDGDGGGPTDFEPGSGTTIMGYAGLCGTDNVSFDTDYFFHSGSYDRIIQGGNSCATYQTTGNTAPVVTINSPAGVTIPKSTAFTLTGNGSDADGDNLIYNWDQMDRGPISPLGNPSGTAPLFRFRTPEASPNRTFPQLSTIINNSSDPSEVLPDYSRTINFRLVARDMKAGGSGVNYASYSLDVTDQAGPFVVTFPNTNVTWSVGETQTVSWDVAGTDQAPVNCSNVNILFSSDGGQTYPFSLATNVPNTGTATVTVPNFPGSSCRLKVEAGDNIFFDISNSDFSVVEPVVPTFTIDADPAIQSICGLTDAVYELNLTALSGFNEEVTLSATNLPPQVNVSFSTNPITPSGTVTMTLSNLSASESGDYDINVNGVSSSQTVSKMVQLELYADIPSEIVHLSAPSDGTTEVPLQPYLQWNKLIDATEYMLEMASSPGFGATTISTITTSDTSYSPANLDLLTVYYWRVAGLNSCGQSPYSTVYAFQTDQPQCISYSAQDVPVVINPSVPNTVSSQLTVANDLLINDINVLNVNGSHSYVSDLAFQLTSPLGTEITLMGNVCGAETDFDLGFDDESVQTTINCPITNQAIYQPQQALSSFDGENSAGDWTLTVVDYYEQDGGSLDEWILEICHQPAPIIQPDQINNQALEIYEGTSETIDGDLLHHSQANSTNSEIIYTILSDPNEGTLTKNGQPVSVGNTFHQQDIDEGHMVYTNDNSSGASSDQFVFDVTSRDGGWLSNQVFAISIQQNNSNNLDITASITQELNCYQGEEAEITVEVSGGQAPFEYRKDNNNWQSSPVFSGLAAGSYTLTVRDANEETRSTSPILIEAPEILVIEAIAENNTLSVTASGGSGSLEYKIDDNAYQSGNVFTDLPNGSYTLTVKDAKGCTNSTTATVAVSDILLSAIVSKFPDCYNDSNAEIELSATGGIAPYQYSMDGINFQSTPIFTGLSAGSYQVLVKDARDTMKEGSNLRIENPDQLLATANAIEENIVVEAEGGTGSLSYSLDGTSFQESHIFSELSNGSYTIVIMDSIGCSTTASASVSVNTLVVSAELEQPISCFGDQNGLITAQVEGGTPPYSYTIDGENYQAEPSFDQLAPGNYSITVLDAQGFSRTTDELVLTEPEVLQISIDQSGEKATVSVTGGSGQYIYSLDDQPFQQNPVFDQLINGQHAITVKDDNNCQVTINFNVNANTLLVSVVVKKEISCKGSGDGQIGVEVSGGTPPYLYSIDGGENHQSSNVFISLDAGIYECTVIDAEGFIKSSAPVILENPDLITLETKVEDNTIRVIAAGGTGELFYSIDGTNFQSSNVFLNVANGDYVVTVKDKNGCRGLGIASVRSTAIFEIRPDELSFSLYPNPSSGYLTLETDLPTSTTLTLRVFNPKGQLMMEREWTASSGGINLNHLPSGVYQLQLNDGMHFGNQRIVLFR